MSNIEVTISSIEQGVSNKIGEVFITQGEPHPKIAGAFWFYYESEIKGEHGTAIFEDRLVHSPKSGIARLLAKVFKAVKAKESEENETA